MGAAGSASLDLGECTICTEELLLADAAMRCNGDGGKRHYFHAHCLTSWIRQCRSNNNEVTCPECRGPVQVRPQRLEEFLREKGERLRAEDQEALRSVRDAAAGCNMDSGGWSDLRQDLLKAGAVLAVGGAIALAVAAGVSAFSRGRGEEPRRNSRR